MTRRGADEAAPAIARVARLTHENRDAVEAILGSFGPTAQGPGPRHPPSIPRPDSDDEYLGAFDGQDRLIGYACFGSAEGTDRGYDLYWIAVHPTAQHSGCGTTLLAAVERRLKELTARFVMVNVSSRPDHAPIRDFYAAREYTAAATVRGYFTPSDDRIIFMKRFQPLIRRRSADWSIAGAAGGASGQDE